MFSGKVKVTHNASAWAKKETAVDRGALTMATEILRRAQFIAPVGEVNGGGLVNSGRVDRNGLASYAVSFGGTSGGFSVPYAKMRHFVNKKNPQTLGYLQRGGDSISTNSKKQYFAEV